MQLEHGRISSEEAPLENAANRDSKRRSARQGMQKIICFK